ncbi:NCS2 family permease [Aeromicrobium tamlense]|uniref:AGZA family xanthine/uracil permease-like MFS transporter n=1 Tax=Aeromicrobium tamlense TaxID=375541 RepID=A0A8I0KHY5_9ACTN|nr:MULTISPECIES: NCS2 family permease [Aeromicrobium]MBD1270035.1 NCS2 family permease [Aeromicrobium tamlense]NYI39307.1 AGZA family xanthine/uracil permease-like MFS transporter [Aeromicrobium tamlense]
MVTSIDRFFKVSQRGSSIGQEVRGGVVTFLTMAYIIVLNPIILSGVADVDGNFLGGGSEPGSGFATIAACTALVAGVLTILMGVVANFPIALATGLGLNAFVAFSVASQMTWADAMGLVVLEGIVILVLVLTGFRKAVFDAVPGQLKTAIAVGIGLFLTLIGLIDAGFVRATGNAAPPIGMGIGGELSGWPVLVFCIGLLLMISLHTRRVPGAILIGIAATTVLAIIVQAITDTPGSNGDPTSKGWNLNVPAFPKDIVEKPDLSLLGSFNLLGSFERVGVVAAVLLVFTLMLADFFDTMGTMTAVGAEAGLNDEDGAPEGSQRILIVDSVAAAVGGAAGISSNTSYVESTAGVADGARTGLASVITGLCFLLATIFTPIVQVIPNEAAVAALVLVGFLMMTQVTEIDWKDPEIAIPAFLTIAFMPFTYSITAGIGAGFLAYVVLKVVMGKIREVHVLLWIIAVLFVIYFAIDPITRALT